MHVILGELVPKTLALQRSEQVALAVAAPMEAFLTLTRPVLFFMRRSGGLVLRIFGAQDTRRRGAIHSPDELKLIVTASRQFGQIPEFQEEMIHSAIELDSITVREVMVARPDIFSLPSRPQLDEALARVVEGQHSRIPVYDPQRGPEHIVGVLYYKDLMRWMRLRLSNLGQSTSTRISRMQISQIMHDVLVVPETKVLAELLAEFKERRRHLAVVVDEFGSTAGVITVEDILEQLVGNIEDEFDVSPSEPALEDESVILLEGSVNIRDLETEYGLTLPRDAGFETLAGFILARLQRIPEACATVSNTKAAATRSKNWKVTASPGKNRKNRQSRRRSRSRERGRRLRGRGLETEQAPSMSTPSKACHPERSTTASNASRRAQSKDPYTSNAAASVSRSSPRIVATLGRVQRTPPCAPGTANTRDPSTKRAHSSSSLRMTKLRIETGKRRPTNDQRPTTNYLCSPASSNASSTPCQ
jgi:CBS domain containing-hemolysin-like protein